MGNPDEFTDNVFEALSSSDRRKLLASLIADSPPDDVAQVVATDDILLYHTHLPKLDDYGLVDWDEDTQEVSKGPNFGQARPFLELLDEHDDFDLPTDHDSVELTVDRQHVDKSDGARHFGDSTTT